MNLPYKEHNKDRLSIIDPNRPENDISGGTKKIDVILQLFSEALDALKTRMKELQSSTRPRGRESQSILAPMLGGTYKLFDEQREHLRQLHREQQEYPR